MRAERIKHMVLVEDFIGSGTRISSFLQKRMHPSIKSWISYGWIKLWIVAYSGLTDGVWAIRACGYKLSEDSFRFVIPPSYARAHFDEAMLEFCVRNSWRTNRSKIPLGFGNGATNLIFEHGCPNNAPVVLWSPGKRLPPRGEKFQPLFPNRGIPTELRQAFGAPTPQVAPEILWNAGQYRLALSLLQEKRDGRQSGLCVRSSCRTAARRKCETSCTLSSITRSGGNGTTRIPSPTCARVRNEPGFLWS
jgi:hypothetical protein